MTAHKLKIVTGAFMLGLLTSCEKVNIPTEGDESDEEEEEPKPNPEPTPDPEKGYLTVKEAQNLYNNGVSDTATWIVGYIVGTTKSSIKNVIFSTSTSVRSNVILADNINENNSKNCFPVMLSTKGTFRNDLNLVDHPENWHRSIMLYGSLSTYFNVAGVRDIFQYSWWQGGTPDNPEIPDKPGIDDDPQLIPGGR